MKWWKQTGECLKYQGAVFVSVSMKPGDVMSLSFTLSELCFRMSNLEVG